MPRTSNASQSGLAFKAELTLITSGLNIWLGNESFDAKREKLKTNTLLASNQEIIGKESWTETDIEVRGAKLADMAIDCWPRPASIE